MPDLDCPPPECGILAQHTFLLCVQARELLQTGEALPAPLVAGILEEKLTSPEVQHYGRTSHWPGLTAMHTYVVHLVGWLLHVCSVHELNRTTFGILFTQQMTIHSLLYDTYMHTYMYTIDLSATFFFPSH